MDYALQELMKQAAKVGANMVVIQVTRTDANVIGFPLYSGSTSGGYVVPCDKEVVVGTVIYVAH